MLAIVTLLIRVLLHSRDKMKYLPPRNRKGKETSSMILTAQVLMLFLVNSTLVAGTEPHHPVCTRHEGSHTSIFTTSLLSAAGMEDFPSESQWAENDAVAQTVIFSAATVTISSGSETQQPFFAQYVQALDKLLHSTEQVPKTAWRLKTWNS